MTRDAPKGRLHYGWVIVAAGGLTLFSCLGLARFAYSMLLPSMAASLQLGFDRMGYISTGNFAGYLTAVALSPFLIRRFGGRRTITGALALIALTMAAISQSSGFAPIFVLYFLTGVGSGLANVPAMVLIGHWFARRLRGRATGSMLTGNGVGIIFAGFLVPALNHALGAEGWRTSWLVLGGVTALVVAAAWALFRDSPAAMGLEPAGGSPAAAPGVGDHHDRPLRPSLLLHLGAIYFAFGVTYMIYGTFLVTSMVTERGMAEASAGRFWAWVGFFSLFSGPLFGAISDRIGRKRGFAVVFAVQTAAYLLAGGPFGEAALYLSVALYGLAAWAIPTIMGATAADYVGPVRAAGLFSAVTFFFAAGQTLGPGVAGLVAEKSHTFSSSFLLSAVVTTGGALLAILLRPPADAEKSAGT